MFGPWMRGWCGRWAALALGALTWAMPAAGQAFLDRIKQRGQVTIGYRVDSPPFSYLDAVGNPIGYGLDLCQPIALRLATEAGLESPAGRYLPVDVRQVVRYVNEGNVALMCKATSSTTQRPEVFSVYATNF